MYRNGLVIWSLNQLRPVGRDFPGGDPFRDLALISACTPMHSACSSELRNTLHELSQSDSSWKLLISKLPNCTELDST